MERIEQHVIFQYQRYAQDQGRSVTNECITLEEPKTKLKGYSDRTFFNVDPVIFNLDWYIESFHAINGYTI